MKNIKRGGIFSYLTTGHFFVVYFFLSASSLEICAQNLISNPECVTYDAIFDRYLVSCFYAGKVVAINSQGVQSNWKTGLGYCYGSTIYGDDFYVSTGKTVRGFNLSSGSQIMNVYIASSHQMDGMVCDTSGNLYIADFHYQGSDDQIFKINLATHAYWAFVPPGHGLQEGPQDIAYDRQNNRLIVVSAYVTPIVAVSLTDSSVITVFNSPTVNDFDGIAEDSWGNYYTTSYPAGCVYKFDHSFLNIPIMIASGFNGPSNLCYNPVGNKLAIPVFYSDTVVLLTPPPEAVQNQSEFMPKDFILHQNYPNPFNPVTTIGFSVGNFQFVALRVFDVTGIQVAEVFKGRVGQGMYNFNWDGSAFASGIYFYRLETPSGIETRKMILLK
jgi:DNA-binding beta-propeller fold protein YncE